jgi:hypothetical protein
MASYERLLNEFVPICRGDRTLRSANEEASPAENNVLSPVGAQINITSSAQSRTVNNAVGLPDGIRHGSRTHPALDTYGYIITATDQQERSPCLAACCRHCPVRITHGVALRAFISVGESGSRKLRVCCSGLGRVHVSEDTVVRTRPNHLLERTRPSRSRCNPSVPRAGSRLLSVRAKSWVTATRKGDLEILAPQSPACVPHS